MACFTDSQVHPVSTRLPQAPLCLGCLAKTSPAKLKMATTRHKPPPAFLGTRGPDFWGEQNKMQRFLFSSAEPRKTIRPSTLRPKPPDMSSELLKSLLPQTGFMLPSGPHAGPPQGKAPIREPFPNSLLEGWGWRVLQWSVLPSITQQGAAEGLRGPSQDE